MFQLKRIGNGPVLGPNKNSSWEAEGVFNPGVVKIGDEIIMLYRAVGEKDNYISHIGLAKSKDGINFERVNDIPFFGPSQPYDKWATEDPRITKIDEDYYITYVAVGDKIMDHGKSIARETPLETSTALLKTRDFTSYENLGIISPAGSDNKDIVLFPKKIPFTNSAGETTLRYGMLHRPNHWSREWLNGPHASKHTVDLSHNATLQMPQKPSMWISWSDDLIHWTDHKIFMQPSHLHDAKNGPGIPPIETPEGWLVIYHHVKEDHETKRLIYTARAMLFDLIDPTFCLGKLPYDILEPQKDFETENGSTIIFPTGGYIENDTLYVYYGCSDKYIGLASGSLSELLEEFRHVGPPIRIEEPQYDNSK